MIFNIVYYAFILFYGMIECKSILENSLFCLGESIPQAQ